jgi:hypothetical protein
MLRKELNKKIGALAFGRLRLSEDIYRQIVVSIDPKSEGHVTRCDDESANLVLIALRRFAEKNPLVQTNVKQHRFIARLMDYLRWNWQDTAVFCHRQTGKKSTRECTAVELTKIVNGMVAIIDGNIASGKLQLSPTELEEYHRHTKKNRQTKSAQSAISAESASSEKSQ